VCARLAVPAGPTRFGDANGDGRTDISDGVWLARNELSGGPAPACGPCVDFQGKERYGDVGHAAAIWYYLFSGTMSVLPDVPEDAAIVAPGAPPECASVDLGFEVVSPTSVAVTLETGGLSAEAWSYGVTDDGCTIVGATTAGTDAADALDAPAGLRTRGFDRTDAVNGAATSAVVLSWRDPVSLPSDGPRRVAMLTLQPGSGCECTLSFSDSTVGRGQPVQLAVTEAGWSFVPDVHPATVRTCE
jgi:hypothetical protein